MLDKQTVIKTLACMQLKRLIEKGNEEAKLEWKHRWRLDYPFYRSIRGIEREDERGGI
jgi:hypothetical protein